MTVVYSLAYTSAVNQLMIDSMSYHVSFDVHFYNNKLVVNVVLYSLLS